MKLFNYSLSLNLETLAYLATQTSLAGTPNPRIDIGSFLLRLWYGALRA